MEKQSLITSASPVSIKSSPPSYSDQESSFSSIPLNKASSVSKSYLQPSRCFSYKIYLVISTIGLSIIILLFYATKVYKGSIQSQQKNGIFPSYTASDSSSLNVLKISDLLTAVPYSYVDTGSTIPLCIFGEEYLSSIIEDKYAHFDLEVFSGVNPEIMSHISSTRVIDNSITQCMSQSTGKNETLTHAFKNVRFIKNASQDDSITLKSSYFHNLDSLLANTIEELALNQHFQNFSVYTHPPYRVYTSLLEKAKNFLFNTEPTEWIPTTLSFLDLSFNKNYLINHSYPFYSNLKAPDSAIFRFRYEVELETFFLSSFSTYYQNSSLIRLSQEFLNDLVYLYNDESQAEVFKQKYGSHIFQMGTLGGYFDVLLEVNLDQIRDPFDEAYYERLTFCLEDQFKIILKYLINNHKSEPRYPLFQTLVLTFLEENPQCHPLCYASNSSDMLLPRFLKSIHIRSSHIDHWSSKKISSSLDLSSISSLSFLELLSQWLKEVHHRPRLIRGKLIPLYDLINIFSIPFQQQFYLWSCLKSGIKTSPFATVEEYFSEFESRLVSQQLMFSEKISDVIDSIEDVIFKLYFILKYSKSSSSFIVPGSSFDRITSISTLASRYQSRRAAIISREEEYLNTNISILDLFVNLHKPLELNSSSITVGISFQKAYSAKATLDWTLYQDSKENPFNFKDYVGKSVHISNTAIASPYVPPPPSFLSGHTLKTSSEGFHFDSVVRRTFSSQDSTFTINMTSGLFPSFGMKDEISTIKELGFFLPLDEKNQLVSANAIVLSFGPIEPELFDYMSKFENPSEGNFLDTFAPLHFSDFSIRVNSLSKLFSMKKANYDTIEEAQNSPFISNTICPPCNSIDNLSTSSSSHTITKKTIMQNSKCFSLVVNFPEPAKIIAITCVKNTPRKSNLLLNQYPTLRQKGQLLHIPLHCQIAYFKDKP